MATVLKLSSTTYWTTAVENTLYFDDEINAFHISISETSRMLAIMRDSDQTIKDAITVQNSGFPLKVAVNAMFFGSGSEQIAYRTPFATVDPAQLDIQGYVRQGDFVDPRTNPSPGSFYIRFNRNAPHYDFGAGNPPPGSVTGIGGAGPLIINQKQYDIANFYNASAMAIDPARCEIIGEPGTSQRLLPGEAAECRTGNTHRSNARLAAMMGVGNDRDPKLLGKTTLGHVPDQHRLLFIVQQHNETGGTMLDVRDAYNSLGATNAIFFDGSDSATLFTSEGFAVEPGRIFKNKAIPVAIGFF
ncbi:MAG: phosphodiester glycosidase family protein [Pirellulales bacterium]